MRADWDNGLYLGLDVGSTTVKACVWDARADKVVYTDYRRHGANQAACLKTVLEALAQALPELPCRAAICGSGGKVLAEELGIPFVQEVVANSIAIRRLYPQVRCAIELGGQDAKVVFFQTDPATGEVDVSDMRMNGTCAGGTGAFIDEIASLLDTPSTEFDALASQGTCVHDISGRCGVYAKTDIQPLLNRGVPKEDLALSCFHAIAKQTIGGLAQGRELEPPIIFEGGPCTFNPTLVRVFKERLGLTDEQVVVPEHPETIVAFGAALSLESLFADDARAFDVRACIESLAAFKGRRTDMLTELEPLFANEGELQAFRSRHRLAQRPHADPVPGSTTYAYLGIDCGSTTTKLVLMDDDANLVHSFYASNEGEPLEVVRRALLQVRDIFESAGAKLVIRAVGTTGYGEQLCARALGADCHVVETVAHAQAAKLYAPEVSFILDIGGQDMKAIWLDRGIVTNITVNEACSSGCGSFLESFGATLHIPVEKIAERAFASKSPANLGSRCTVFMNSSIVSEQQAGKTADDIMAGLCRSIVENVFTKVIRMSNMDRLGRHIVVQGGTFRNDAVLRSFEKYVGRDVTRSPYPELMGALGAALLTREQVESKIGREAAISGKWETPFVGIDALDDGTLDTGVAPRAQGPWYTRESNNVCPHCSNHCARTVVRFCNGSAWVTGNRCSRGAELGEGASARKRVAAPNLFDERMRLLRRDYEVQPLRDRQNKAVGIPLVLSYWDTLPFWKTFWQALGYDVRVSTLSTRRMYEEGLPAVTSDTVCFPAKLVHGHIRQLEAAGVDFIFMPTITTVAPDNPNKDSESMCAVVKGYPMVVRNSDNPAERGTRYENPLFHWHTEADRRRQLCEYMSSTWGIDEGACRAAMEQGDRAQASFSQALQARGALVIQQAREAGTYAVVLASRPYHNDPLVHHGLPELFCSEGIPVLCADAVPGVNEQDLSGLLIDVVNNYHARMLSCAAIAARDENLEYVQLVSFGCGHDAYLTDEIVRLMGEISGKVPLVVKLDESDVSGPLRIRVQSFIQTTAMRRATGAALEVHEMGDPYPRKFTREDQGKTILVPNTSHAFSRIMAAAMAGTKYKAAPLEVGREEAIRLGKKYVHNDICFPAQIVIGEALAALESGKYDTHEVAIAMAKYVGDCRLTHYVPLLRRALDDAGYDYVPIVSNDDADAHNIQPGYTFGLGGSVRLVAMLPMIDALEELLRKIRPYELARGTADAAFERGMDLIVEGMEKGGVPGCERAFKQAIAEMRKVPYDRSNPRPRVLIVGEYLLNFHPGANRDIELYLENNGMEIVEAKMTDVIQKTYFYMDAQVREYKIEKPFTQKAFLRVANKLFDMAHDACDRIACAHPLYERPPRMGEVTKASDPVIHHTFDAGEGVLIPAEIMHHAAHGVNDFIILQPFGCLPNHVVGRGIVKRLKEMYPRANILALDYDPDTSFANVENRLQMLIMGARKRG